MRVLISVLLLSVLIFLRPDLASAQSASVDLSGRQKGSHSGLPVPRFVSLKADEVNVRRGPGWDTNASTCSVKVTERAWRKYMQPCIPKASCAAP